MKDTGLSRSDRFNYTFGLGTYKALSIVTAIIVAYLLQSEGYGLLTFAQASATMVASVGSLAIPTLMIREISKRTHDRAAIFRGALLLTSACVVTAIILLLLFTIFVVGFDDLPEQLDRLGVPIVLGGSAIYSLGQVFSDLVAAALLAEKQSRTWARWLVIQSSVVTLASILASLTNNAAVVLIISGGTQLLISFAGILWLRQDGYLSKVKFEELRGETQRQLESSLAPGLASQSIAVANWFTTVVLAAQTNGATLIGWYTIAYKIASGLAFIPEATVTARTTAIYDNVHTRRFYQLVRGGLKDCILVGTLAIVVVGISAHFISSLGAGYIGAESLVLAMALTIPLRAAQGLFSVGILAIEKTRVWTASYLAGAVVYLIGLSSVWVVGVLGVAIASIASYLIEILILAIFVFKESTKTTGRSIET